MGAAGSEFHYAAVARLSNYAGRLSRDQGLECDGREQVSVRDLRLDDRRTEREDRLAREEDGSFRHGGHVAGEAEFT